MLFLLFGYATQAQNIASIKYGSTLAINEVDLEFIKVIEDSRCPSNVNCVQAGKAVVLVNIFINGSFFEERQLEFYPSGFSDESLNTLFRADGLQIKGLNLMPYPIALTETSVEDYYLELGIYYN